MKHHLTADPERSDIVHDLLASLAEQMVDMNKAKGEEIRGFLRYLEREIGVEIDMLKNKTAIQSYFDLLFERLLEILRRNRRSTPINLSDRNFQESLEREFTSSCAKLNPLLTRIQQTDVLIDQVVYQLYGLNRSGNRRRRRGRLITSGIIFPIVATGLSSIHRGFQSDAS